MDQEPKLEHDAQLKPPTNTIETLDATLALELAVALGLTPSEYEKLVAIQGRLPSLTELYMYSLMWSEHCSYKHSKKQLRKFSSEGKHVLQGPGENAGVISVGGGWAVSFKMESHNHPSAIDPFEGAATGVGGAVRDIFSMGARPIACLSSLRFGSLEEPRQRWLLEGATRGIASYCKGLEVPAVGGEVYFEDAYAGNCLVNAMAVGLMRESDLICARGSGPGNYVVLMGAATGRDGIGGASVLASQGFSEASDESLAVTQVVGNPHLEKLLIEVCLELLKAGKFVALGDLGAAGFTSAASEMACRGGVGIDIDVRKVPQREEGMVAFEVMVSESQERMLAVVTPEDWPAVFEVCKRWGVEGTIVGTITNTGNLVVRDSGLPEGQQIVADVSAEMLAESAPVYDPVSERPTYLDEVQSFDTAAFLDESIPAHKDLASDLLTLLASPNICSRQWLWSQCSSEAQDATVIGPGGDAAVLRIGVDTGESASGQDDSGSRGIALAADCNGRYCYLDPYVGAQLAVAECARNISCVGAEPAAVTDCLNFGSPEKPEVFYTFDQAVSGLADACKFFGIPVVSGNVSFYNESQGAAIYPTPAVGVVGILEDTGLAIDHSFKQAGDVIVLVGQTANELGGSEYLKVVFGKVAGRPPALDLSLEKDIQAAVRTCIQERLLASAHDLSEGGLAVALAESCVAANLGASVVLDEELPAYASLFSESASRILISTPADKLEAVLDILVSNGAPYSVVGEVEEAVFTIKVADKGEQVTAVELSLEEIKSSYLDSLGKLLKQQG